MEKSIEAYVLALETINRLTIQYRLETFCFLFCNAWELLLKAKTIYETGSEESIFHQKLKGQSKRSLSLQACLKQEFPNDLDPVRRNIERIKELRDESVHLVIGEIPRELSSLFQAGVINYHNRLNKWFQQSLSDRFPVGMMSIVYDRSPEKSDIGNSRLQRQLGPDAASFLTRYCADIRREFDDLKRPPQFSIPVDYHLVLTKNPRNADIFLSFGLSDGESTRILETAKDPFLSHPYRQKELLEEARAVYKMEINQHDIKCLNKVYGIKERREFFFQGQVPGSPGQYSNEYMAWLYNRFRQDDQFFEKTRAKAKAIGN